MANSQKLKKATFSRPGLIAFVLVFGVVGGYIIFRSFAAGPVTFGNTTAGISLDTATDGFKVVSQYTAPSSGKISKLTGYISGLGAASGSQPLKAVVYADSSGSPGALLGTSNQVTVTAGQPLGWVDFTFSSPISVTPGAIWMGYIAGSTSDLTQLAYTPTTGAGTGNPNTGGYAAGPTNPFGSRQNIDFLYSLYATYQGSSSIGDINGDGSVNVSDLSAMLTDFNTSAARSDLNSDSIVNILDLSILLSNYGSVSTPAPTVSLSASPTSIASGSASTLTWSSTNATSCTASGSWSGTKSTSGSVSTGALSATSSYILTCTGSSGSGNHSATVTVTGGGTDTSSFDAATNFTQPAFTPTRTVTVTSQSQLSSAISSMQPGDLINCTGNFTVTGEFAISKQLASYGEIHLNGTKFTGMTDGTNLPAVWINNTSNIRIYGGEVTNDDGGNGVLVYTATNVTWWNFVIHDTGNTGLAVFPVAGLISNLDFKGEIYDWGHNLSFDPHAEKGSGLHGANLDDASGGLQNSRFALYLHDGPTGAGVEMGASDSSDFAKGNQFYLKCVNLTFHATSQVGGNCIQYWGHDVTNNVIQYLEATNLQGRAFDANAAEESLASNSIVYGRASNTNLNNLLGSTESGIGAGVIWDTRGGIQLGDVSPKP